MNISGIICGLGNPGSEYRDTRHNIGFIVIDSLVKILEKSSGQDIRLIKETSSYCLWEWNGHSVSGPWVLLKPMTYMNRSGGPVRKFFSRTKFDAEKLLVIHDEADFPLGKLRIKAGGGLAGHNGLKSIADSIGTRDFRRLRVGIGHPETREHMARYVLSRFLPEERELKDRVTERAVQVVRLFRDNGFKEARDEIARFPLLS